MSDVTVLSKNDVPCLDLSTYRADARRLEQRARQSLDELGFLVLDPHPVDLELLRECYALGRAFFDLSSADKQAIASDRIDQKRYGNVGYYSYMREQAVGAHVPDLKEFFHIGQMIDEGHEMSPFYPQNRWPAAPERFRDAFSTLYRQMEACGKLVLEILGRSFGIDQGYLDELLWYGNSILRMLHYPLVDSAHASQGGMRAAPHTGINLIGLQPPASHPGLQFWTPQEQWVCLGPAFADTISVNIGEMLGFLLSSRLPATLHQVVNPPQEHAERRFSIVYFVHPNSERQLVPHDAAGQPVHERAIKAGDWLLERLDDIKIRERRGE
jgi:isopenicillin N synthase-like dioxygenase